MSISLTTVKLRAQAGNQKLGNTSGATVEPGNGGDRSTTTPHRLTLEGTLYIGLALLIGISVINTGTNLLYLVLSMLLSTLIVSGVLSWLNLSRLEGRRHYPTALHAGQEATGMMEVRNGKRMIHGYALRIRDQISGPEGAERTHRMTLKSFVLQVDPRGYANAPVAITLPERGLYRIHQVRILSRFPFGFFDRSRGDAAAGRILAYPALLSPISLLPHLPRLAGELDSARKGHGGGLYGIRDYQLGDPSRRIHWKHSARGVGVKLKEVEHEQSIRYLLLLDLRSPQDPGSRLREHFELAVSVAATLAHLLLSRSILTGLWTSMGNIPLGVGGAHLKRLYHALAMVNPQSPETPPVAPERDSGGVTLIRIEYCDRRAVPGWSASGMAHPLSCEVIDVRKLVLTTNPSYRIKEPDAET